jgi:hypothetical protein
MEGLLKERYLKGRRVPFKSQQQRKFMYSQHPDIAERWRKESGPQKGLPDKVTKHQAAAKRKIKKK